MADQRGGDDRDGSSRLSNVVTGMSVRCTVKIQSKYEECRNKTVLVYSRELRITSILCTLI